MDTFRKIIIVLLGTLALLSCESPFKAGLGSVVDLHPPLITLESPATGSYLWGTEEFTGYAEDDYYLASVQFRVTSHGQWIQKTDGTDIPNPYFEWTELLPKQASEFQLRFEIDTAIFNDGDFTVKLRARDRADNVTETDDFAFHIKNEPPVINMSLPFIEKISADSSPADERNYGKLGSHRLNWDFFRDQSVGIARRMDSEGRMIGVISDARGVNKHGDTEGRFPPQIRFWQIRQDAGQGADEYPNIRLFDPGYMPSFDEVSWENLRRLEDLGLHEVQFGYDLPKAAGKLFAFQIRAMSLDDRGTSYAFPKDHWTGEQWDSLPDDLARFENEVVLLNINTPDEFPTVDLWGMEDINRKDAWNSSTGTYDRIDHDRNEYNPYFDEAISVKNGQFALRIKASHSMGINSAAVYFERDSGYRGRFIWDPANEGPQGWDGWNATAHSVSIARPYTEWGRNDPNSVVDNLPPNVRNFVFTCRDESEVIPANAGYHAGVAGRARIQLYTGAQWLAGGRLNTGELEDSDDWADLPGGRLEEGEYKISVTARSGTGTPLPAPRDFTLKIDRMPPEIAITGFRGGYEEYDDDGPLYRVNGVVEPELLITDLRAADSSLRQGSAAYFRRSGGSFGYEQLFMVIRDSAADVQALEEYLDIHPKNINGQDIAAAHRWPDIPDAAGGLEIPGLQVWKDGPVDITCRFKASPIFASGTETDVLEDGEPYLLYVLARDNAFNIGYRSFRLIVDYDSDLPVLDFSVGSINPDVVQPNYGDPGSFEYAGGLHNIFNANSSIRLRLRDDDGLDLGVRQPALNEPSGVRITMTGFQVIPDAAYPQGKIVPLPEEEGWLIEFPDEQVKNIFAPQPVYNDSSSLTPNWVRRVVKERQGTITHAMLLNAMKSNAKYDSLFVSPPKAEAHTLPDGLYRIAIEVSDYSHPGTKLTMDPDEPLDNDAGWAAPAKQSSSFWIAVDSSPPQIDRQAVEPLTGSFISGTNTTVTGTVADENGPITADRLRVTQTIAGQVLDRSDKIAFGPVTLVRKAGWEYDFAIPITVMAENLDGTFDFEAVFSDRFGVETRLPLSYSIDGIPPTVSLTRAIDTFEREADDLVSPAHPDKAALEGLLAGRPQNMRRLANKVISFTVNPSDNLGVAGVRWWLLRTDYGSNGPAVLAAPGDYGALAAGQDGSGLVLDYNAYPSNDPAFAAEGVVHNIQDGANLVGKYGVIDMRNGRYTVVIDTDSAADGRLPDGEYRLHIIAVDSAGNVSRSASGADGRPAESFYQTIFLLQEQDLPYFAEMPPGDMVVGPNDLVLRGMIFEDDGFTDADGKIWPASIKLWYSSDPAATSDVDAINSDGTYTGYIGPYYLKSEDGLTPLGRNLSFNVKMVRSADRDGNVTGLFTDGSPLAPGGTATPNQIGGDGKKHFIIEAMDAPTNKIQMDGTRGPARPANPGLPDGAADPDGSFRIFSRKHFDFMYDTIPPAITISHPESGQTFNVDAPVSMNITGFIEDANLLTYKDDSGAALGYGIGYRLRGTSGMWHLGDSAAPASPDKPYITLIETLGVPGSTSTRVSFVIPAAAVTKSLDFNNLPPGPNTLELSVEDMSGKLTPHHVVFIKDVIPPTFSFTSIGEFPFARDQLDAFGIGDWWAVSANPAEEAAMNLLKWHWLNKPENRLDAETGGIISYNSGVPVLSGIFDDDISDVSMSSFRYWIDGETGTGRTAAKAEGSGSNWRWSVDLVKLDGGGVPTAAPLDDGVHSIRLYVEDVPGNILSAGMFFFRIDRDDPAAAITHINGEAAGTANTVFGRRDGFSADDPVFTITGTASDANIEKVHLEIAERANPSAFVPLDPQNNQNRHIVLAYNPDANAANDPLNRHNNLAFGTGNPPESVSLNWRFDLTRAVYDGLRPGIGYNVKVAAFDSQGNESEEDIWTFVKDDTPPDIDFTGLVKGGNASLLPSQLSVSGPAANANVIVSQTAVIQGTAIDRDNISAIAVLQGRLEQWNWAGNADTGWILVPGNDWADILDGTNPAADGSSANVPWIWTFPDLPEGLYRMRVRARDSAWIASDPGSTDWTAEVGGGNPAISEWLYFFFDRNDPAIELKLNDFYSSRKTGGTLPLTLPVSDANRLSSLAVAIVGSNNDAPVPGITGGGAIGLGNQNTAAEQQSFAVTFAVPADGTVEDGYYRLKVTAVDMAGRKNEAYGNFTLDNTAPEVGIVRPELARFSDAMLGSLELEAAYPGWKDQYGSGSEILLGGQNETITGTTEDISDSNAESGVKAMWYHLGFLGGSDFPTEKEIRETVIPAGADDSGEYDSDFDAAALAAAGNAWFKLGGSQVPPGFSITSANIYDWILSIPTIYPGTSDDRGGLKIYASAITVKGREYNGTALPNLRMTRPVPAEIAGRSEIVRMPLWIRVADNAGNISYQHRDIWFNPNGDRPNTTVLNPSSQSKANPRGGTISADGLATNNLAVRNVAFRVKVDAYPDSAPADRSTVPPTPAAYGSAPPNTVITASQASGGGIVSLSGNERLLDGEREVTEYLAKIPSAAGYPEGTGGYGIGPWYLANLEVTRGSPEIPWNFTFNSQGEITDLIEKHGFNSVTGLPAAGAEENDTIRVWLEVFAFRGAGQATSISINTDDGGSVDAPKPYVRVFYINKSAPSILSPKIWNGANVPGSEMDDYRGAGLELRSGNFALRTTLDSGSDTKNLTQIAVRRTGEAGAGWVVVWDNSSGMHSIPGMALNWEAAGRRAVFDMRFSTTIAQADFGLVKERASTGISEWRSTGGRYPIEIRVRDSSLPPAEASHAFDIGIDNFAPAADTGIVTNGKVAGTNQDFLGRVFDYSNSMVDAASGAPRKIEKVFVWFTKNNSADFVNINTGARSGALTGTMSAMTGREAQVTAGVIIREIANEGVLGTVSYPASAAGAGQPFDVSGGWVREISEDTAVTGSRMLWIPNGSSSFRYDDVTWIMNINTTVLPDGNLTINYIAMDEAGNASHFTQQTLVKNKYPQIDKVTLYTDNNGVGAVYSGGAVVNNAFAEYELRNFDLGEGYLDSGFISKNEFVAFKVETSSGNRPLNYRLQYVQRERLLLSESNLNLMKANSANGTWSDVYTVAEHGDYGMNRWQTLGANTAVLPPKGTNFVLGDFVTGAANADEDNYIPGSAFAEVWRYRPVPGIARNVAGKAEDAFGNNDPVLPNDASPPDGAESGDGFNFKGSAYFGAGKIEQADGSRPDSVSNDAATAFFLIKVWDSVDTSPQAEENDQLYDALVVGMNVYLEDTIAPTVRLYDLNPYTETLAVNNNSTQGNLAATIRRALDPRGIGENILRGGLYNDTNNADVELMPSGHIEPKTYATGTAGPNPLYPWVKTGSGYIAYSANGFTAGDDPDNAMRDGASITRDKVSGRVIVRGQAHDDQLIREIRISISTGSTPDANLYDPALGQGMAILKLDTSGTAATNPNYYTLQPAPGVNANVYQEFHWRDGHTVEWSYVWDTEARPNPAGEPVDDVGIWVAAIDHLGGGGTGQPSAAVSTDNYVTEVFKTTLRADIVPYVTGFERQGKYATVRSRQGWYSFYEGEQDIALLGYNLAGSGNTLALQYGGNALADVFNLPIMSHNKNRVVFNVPEMQQTSSYTDDNSTHSGKIILKVNGTQEALNHGSNFDQSWNREDNAEGADLWINRPYAHIWRSRHQDGAHTTFFGSAISTLGGANGYGLSTPAMALEYASVANLGRLTGVWAVYGAANMYYVRGAGRTGTAIFSGVPIEPYMGTDVSFYNGAVANGAMVHNYEADGSPNFRVRHGANFGTNYTFVNSNGPTKRYTNNRVVRTGGQSHVTTYDAYTSSLRFGTRGGTTATYFIDGASISSNASYDSVIPDSNDAGLYSAIDYDSIGPLIAYYDVQNDSLRLASTLEFIAPVSGTAVAGGSGNSRPFVYAGHRLNVGDRVYANNTERRVTWVSGSQFKLATNATGTSNYNPTVSSGPYTIIRQGWSKNYVVPPGSPFHSGSGRDVSIKVDKDNGIHLAFRNTNKNAMMYAYAASRDVAFTVYTVDTVVKGGTWTNVSVDNDGNPWIVYGSSSIGSYDGARMAYRSDIVSGNDRWFDRNVAGENTAGNNSYGWEAVSLPSDYAVSDDRLSIEVWPPTDRANYRSGLIPSNQAIWDEGPGWDAVIGYASDRYRLAYFYKPEWKDY